MKQRKMTISLVWANVFAAIFCFAILLLSSAAWYFVWGFPTFEDFPMQFLPNHSPLLTSLIVFVALMAGMVVHELIHGLTWAYFAKKGFKSIRFGIFWEMLTPLLSLFRALNGSPILHRCLNASRGSRRHPLGISLSS